LPLLALVTILWSLLAQGSILTSGMHHRLSVVAVLRTFVDGLYSRQGTVLSGGGCMMWGRRPIMHVHACARAAAGGGGGAPPGAASARPRPASSIG